MAEQASLLTTGVPGLDLVLGGGLSRRSLVSIVGAPGAGKTVLASQILFHAARNNLPTIVFTSQSEGSEQYLEHLQGFTFFDPSLTGTFVRLYTLASHLTAQTLSPAAAITATIQRARAKVVLLDGLSIEETSQLDYPAIFSALATQARYLDATVLVTLPGRVRDHALSPHLVPSDVIIGLDYKVRKRRHLRLLDVVKRRGRAQWPGLHSYQISDDGIQVFPRLASYPLPPPRPTIDVRASFGIPELDHLLDGGLSVGTTTLLAGTPGIGKTLLGLTWALAAAEPNARTLFVTFGEHPEQLAQKAAVFGLDLEGAYSRGSITVLRFPPTDIDLDAVGGVILSAIASEPVTRVVIDELALLLKKLGEQAHVYMAALNQQLHAAGVTSLYLLEIPHTREQQIHLPDLPVSIVSDNVLLAQHEEQVGQTRRLLAVLRMRLSAFDPTPQELVVSTNGIQVRPLK